MTVSKIAFTVATAAAASSSGCDIATVCFEVDALKLRMFGCAKVHNAGCVGDALRKFKGSQVSVVRASSSLDQQSGSMPEAYLLKDVYHDPSNRKGPYSPRLYPNSAKDRLAVLQRHARGPSGTAELAELKSRYGLHK